MGFLYVHIYISDNAVQDLVLGAPWFKSSQRLCAYISCSSLREVDTSKLLSQILENPAQGFVLFLSFFFCQVKVDSEFDFGLL